MSEAEEKLRLTSVAIENIWKQTSMKPLTDSIFRFAVEIVLAQIDKFKTDGWKSPEEIALMFNPDYLNYRKGVYRGRKLGRESIIEAAQKLQDLETWAAVEFPEMKRRVHEIRDGLEKQGN